jgi:hypothetical protein
MKLDISTNISLVPSIVRRGLALLLFIGAASTGFAQVDRTSLTGTVTDSTGKVVPGVHVGVFMRETDLHRETVTSGSGTYEIPEMPVGTYTVSFSRDGFSTLSFDQVVQTVGRTRTLNATLRVAGAEERVTVSASSQLLDRSSSAVTGLIEKEQADELPLNGRNWAALTAYVPGAIDTGGSNQRSIRFAGRGLDDSNFTYDGVDSTNIVNQTQRTWVRLAVPLDAIQEFRVDTLTATAEEGATGGAQLAITSPSGTNAFHGRLFEYLRNDFFDAPEPAWAGVAQQPLRLNQFGGSLGGPIVHDKTFFFLASEAYRQSWGYPVSGDIPSPALIASVPASSPVYPILAAYAVAGAKTTVTPYTAAAGPNYADQDLLTCSCTQTVNESSAMLRLDHNFTSSTTGYMRFNYDRSVNTQPFSASSTDLQQRVSTPVNGAIELLHIFTPDLVNEVKFGFNRASSNTYNNSRTGTIYEILVNGGYGPGFGAQDYDYNSIYVGNTFSGIDNLTLTHGRNTLKFGGEFRRVQLNQEYNEHGTVTFSSIESLADNVVTKASLSGALPVNHLRKNDIFLYAQDEYKVRPNLTFNVGLRYTIFQLFTEENGLANPFDFDTCGPQGFCGVGASFGNQNYGDVDPRIGVIWSPDQRGRTIVRAGFGTFHEDGQLDDQNLPAKNEVPSYAVNSKTQAQQLSYPVAPFFGPNIPGTISPNAEQRDRKDTYTEQWSLSLQRELPGEFVSTVSYLGSHGVHLLDTNVVNLITNPATKAVQYPGFSPAIGWRGSIGASYYDGLSLSVRRPFTRSLLVSANYTYSHEIDNGSNGSGDGDEISPQNPLCPSCEVASGAWDARHVVNGNAVYKLPFGVGQPMLNHRGIAETLAGGWEVNTTALARTGFPVNVVLPSSYTAADGASGTERPDLVPGVSLTPPGGRTVAHWINPAAFALPPSTAVFGDAPRDLVRGPGTWQIDLSTDKTFTLTESTKLQFRSEFYNIFNHPQLGQPQATCTIASVAQPGCANGFGNIVTPINLNTSIVSPITPVGSGTPREMQFALRLEF